MTLVEFVDSSIDTLSSQLLHNERFSMIEFIIRALNPKEEDILDVVGETIDRVQKTIEADPGKFLPTHCCANCWGPCGRLRSKLANGFCTPEGRPVGDGCDRFESRADFARMPVVIDRTNRRRGDNYSQQESIQIEKGVVRIRRTTRNITSGRVLKSKSFDKIFVGDTSKFIRRFLRLMRYSTSPTRFFVSANAGIPDACKTVRHGIPLIKGETLEHYMGRIADEVRKQLEVTSQESYDMSYAEAEAFIRSQLTTAEQAALADCKNFGEFLSYAFPRMSIWQAVESIKQEPFLT